MRLLETLKLFLNTQIVWKDSSAFYIRMGFVFLSLAFILLYIYNFKTVDGSILVYIHDNLDSNIIAYKLLADTNTFFASSSSIIPNIMNGIPRLTLPSEYNIVSMLYYFFTPENAYIINEFLIRFIAFFGMLMLLRFHFFREMEPNDVFTSIIIIGTALIFSLLPFWSNAGASIAGQPFVLYAYLNLKNRDISTYNWLILSLYILYSSLYFSGIFVLAMLVVICLYDWIKNKAINYYLLLSILGMSVFYLLVEYRLVLNLIDPIFVPHRIDFEPIYINYLEAMNKSVSLFWNGQYHAFGLQEWFVIPFVFFSILFFSITKKSYKYIVMFLIIIILIQFIDATPRAVFEDIRVKFYTQQYKNYCFMASLVCIGILYLKNKIWALFLLSAIVVISLFGGFESYEGIRSIKENFSILTLIQFDRFYILLPFLWLLLFALISKALLDKTSYSIGLILVILILQINLSFKAQSANTLRTPVSMKAFYSKETFDDIKSYINKPQESYRIISIGLPPSVAIYNGFYTLDAYWAIYPLEYKHEFKKIIEPELSKSEQYRKYFDDSGSRCQLMSSEKNISLNLNQFKKMGGKYIFSSYKVNINEGKGVSLLNVFFRSDNKYKVYLYSVD